MAYITLEEAQALSNRSCLESWDEMIRILTEHGMEKVIARIGKPPKIVWKTMRSSLTSGVYYFPTIDHPKNNYNNVDIPWDDRIEMNIKYLNSKDAIQFAWNTTKHELGHCLNYRMNKRTGHDAAFKAIVTAIGGNPSTYHNYEDSEIIGTIKSLPRTEFTCTCGNHFSLTPIKIKRAKEGKYLCGKCNKNLSFLFNEQFTF